MIKLENWKEVTKGLYRYVVSANCCYEIHIKRHNKKTDILSAIASLYVVGDWHDPKENLIFFERELLFMGPLAVCLEKAVEDEEKMRG